MFSACGTPTTLCLGLTLTGSILLHLFQKNSQGVALIDAVDDERLAASVLDLFHDLALAGCGYFPRRFGLDADKQTVVTNQIVQRALAVAVGHRHEPVTFGVTRKHLVDRLLDGPLGALALPDHQTRRRYSSPW